MDSKALTKIQSAALVAIIIVAAVGGGIAYVLWSGPPQSAENIRIGIFGDLNFYSTGTWQGAVLAAEQINAEGGVLGRNLTVIGEDDYSGGDYDIASASNALTKLITVDKADYVISDQGIFEQIYQDICAEHKTILLSVGSASDDDTQRVLDNYDRYKYFFRVMNPNVTSDIDGSFDCLRTLRNYTGFTKVALLIEDLPAFNQIAAGVKNLLIDHNFSVVYYNTFPPGTTDFTSYFSAIEAAETQILNPLVGISSYSLVKEYYDRQSPFVMWGVIGQAERREFWELTEGKCEYTSFVGLPIIAGYPWTNKTLATREAYIQRWGDLPDGYATATYDAVRFILPDAIRRAGTTETQAVIKALEKTDVETSIARRFVFTSSHDVMIGAAGPNTPSADYYLACMFQWQNGTQVPVYPKEIREGAGAIYKYPNWPGPWDNK